MDTILDVVVKPRWWNTVPEITYGIDNQTINTLTIKDQTTLRISYPYDNGDHKFWLSFNNKNYNDCKLDQNLDMAIEIKSVAFEEIVLDRFIWISEYYPYYPADYPDKQPVIKSATYLGWNGRWELPFTTPVFTWIHRLENLGWLYEP